jgi:hypothetical protein
MAVHDDDAVAALRECLRAYAGDHHVLRDAVMQCAADARGRIPPEALIKELNEQLLQIERTHELDYWRVKVDMIEWMLSAYYAPTDEPIRSRQLDSHATR